MSDPVPPVAAHPVIGILGGMGPDATVDLMRRVIAATPAGSDEDHIHMIVDNNPKVPSRIAAIIEGTGPDPTPELVRMARGLEAAGATALAMACNTAHAYAEDIAAAVRIPLLNMVTLTAERIGGMVPPCRRVGLLASSAIRILGLYEKALAPLGIAVVYPEHQPAVMDVIKAVKRGDTGSANRSAFARIANGLMAGETDLLLVACTELSILTESLEEGTPILDALDVLAAAIVAEGLKSTGPERVKTLEVSLQ
jgi:aspartate racemase